MSSAPAPEVAVPEEAPPPMCARHPTTLAVTACPRCGRFACAGCMGAEQGQPLCADCLARPEVLLRPSARAKQALWLSLFGLHGVVVLLPLGLWFARAELRAIEAGDAPLAGRGWAQGARIAATAGVIVWAGVAVWLAMR